MGWPSNQFSNLARAITFIFKNMLTDYNRAVECLKYVICKMQAYVHFLWEPYLLDILLNLLKFTPIGIILLWHCYISTSLRWDHLWLASSQATPILYKALPSWHCICLECGFGLCTLENHIACSQMSIFPHPQNSTQHQLNISFMMGGKRRFYMEST